MRKQKSRRRDYHEFTDDYVIEHTETSVLFTQRQRTVEFTIKTVSFNAMCVFNEPNDSSYICLLINPSKKEMLVMPTERDARNSIRWKNEDGEPIKISAASLCAQLYTLMSWNRKYKYRVCGSVVATQGVKMLRFMLDTSTAYPIEDKPAVSVEFVAESVTQEVKV